jgi:hypothetical protein
LGEEDAKGASDSILDRVAGVWAWLAMVRQGRDVLVQDCLEIIKAGIVPDSPFFEELRLTI